MDRDKSSGLILPGATYGRAGEEWIWFSRIHASDDELAARLHHPLIETHALVADGRDEGLLELDFRQRETCEIGVFGVTAKLDGSGAGHWLMHRAGTVMVAADQAPLHTCTFRSPGSIAVVSSRRLPPVSAADRD